MQRVAWSVAVFFLAVAWCAGESLVDTDFGKAEAYRPVEVFDKRGESVAMGRLPDGWRDNSSWAQVKVHYDRVEEQGRAFMRIDVKQLISGRVQMNHALNDLGDTPYYRLRFTLRNPGGESVEIGIRMSGSPYSWLWQKAAFFTPDWQEYSYDFQMAKPRQNVSLFIVACGPGAVDIANVQLINDTKEGMARRLNEEYRQAHPEPLPLNRFRLSRMPLGLQNGWSVRRNMELGRDVEIVSDPKIVGPGGAPSLHVRVIHPREPLTLYTAPMGWVDCLAPHVASFYVRGKITGTVEATAGHQADTSKRIDLDTGEKWERFALGFKPRVGAVNRALRFNVRGDFHLDAFQVEEGPEPTAYRSATPCEVALALPESDASVARVQFEDEPSKVRYCVSGSPGPDARLKARLTNVYGKASDLEPVRLENCSVQSGVIDFDAFGRRPYGSFRIEAWVEAPRGKRLSGHNEIVLHRLRRPRYENRDAPESPFGIHTLPIRRHLLMAKAAGFNWVRLHDSGLEFIGWYFLEREKGKWTFFDEDIQRYRLGHLKILGEFGTAPEWASYFSHTTEPCKDGYRKRWFAPTDPEAFGNYCRVVAERYKGVIDDWCMWNEPWAADFFAFDYEPSKTKKPRGFTQPDTAPAYHAELTRQAHVNARAVNPEARIAGVCTTVAESLDSRAVKWTRGIVEAGGLEWCDAYDYHHYLDAPIGHTGDVIEVTVRYAFAPVVEKQGAIDKPLWMTEGQSVRHVIGAGLYKHTLTHPDEDDVWEVSDRLARYAVRMLAVGVERLFLYSMHTHNYFDDGAVWSVLVTPEGYMHPCGAAHSAMAWLIEDTRFLQTVEPVDGVAVHVFQGKGRCVAAVTPNVREPGYELPRDKAIRYLDLFGNPLREGRLGRRMVYAVADKPALWLVGRFQPVR